MSDAALKKKFGTFAFQVAGSLFQHASKIAESGLFLDSNKYAKQTTDGGSKVLYRKGQVHETVPLSAVRSSLAVSAVALGPQDVLVQACGGTPEGILAGMLAGFQNVHYIAANEKEERAMKLPSAEQAFLVETTPAWAADSLDSMDSSGP